MKGLSLSSLSVFGWIVATADGFSSPIIKGLRVEGPSGRQALLSVVTRSSDNNNNKETVIPTSDVVKKVAVTGATGKTGKLVVKELLNNNVGKVIGLVWNKTKAAELFADLPTDVLAIQECNLANPEAIESALIGCDATIWCTTGFLVDPMAAQMPPTKTMSQSQSIDVIGVPAVANAMLQNQKSLQQEEKAYPKVVMCSSAGTTRPSWNKEQKEKLKGCAQIPIVRLNPFGILGLKAKSEQQLQETGVDYCLVRPCGLNNKWPKGACPIFSQGDVAIRRLNQKDLACVLCNVLSLPEASKKTFEMVGLSGYPPSRTIGPALARLKLDSEKLSKAEVEAVYAVAQQLLPGEWQDATALTMGQTYKQLDKGEISPLGECGKENVRKAGIAPTYAGTSAID